MWSQRINVLAMEMTRHDPEPGKVHVDPGLNVLVTQVTYYDPELF